MPAALPPSAVQQFIVDGLHVIQPAELSLGDSFHRAVVDQADALPAAVAAATKLAKLPFDARAETKRRLRLKTATDLVASKARCTEVFCDFALKDDVQAALTAYVASLKQRKAA